MKLFHMRKIATAIALTGVLAATGAAYGKDCKDITQPDAGACPIRVNGQAVFDRCFGSFPGDAKIQSAPDAACNAIRDTKKAADAFERSVSAYLGDAQRDLERARDRMLKNAIDFEAIKDFNEAAQFPQRVAADVKALADDRQCGVNGTIKRVGMNLQNAQKLVNDGFQIGGNLVAVANSQKPSLDEARKIADELNALANLARSSGAEGQKAFQDLQTAINAIIANTQQLVQTDFGKVVSDGTAVAGFVGPFVANCVACAGTIGTSVAAMAGGGAAAAASPAACTTGAGCALAPIGGIAAAVSGAVGSVVSSQPCQAAATDSAKLQEHIDRIQNLVNGAAKLVASIPDNIDKSIKAGDALVKLAEQLGKDAEPRLKNIQTSINRIVANAEKAGDTLEKEIAPRVTRLAGNFLKDMSEEVNVLGTCFNKLLALSGSVSQETLDGIGKLAQAAPALVDAGKVVDNAARALDDGKNAMEAYLNREHRKMATDVKELHKDIWGVNPGQVDFPKTAQHLANVIKMPSRINEISRDALSLIDKEKKIIENAVNAGVDGFLNGPKLQPAKAKYTSAKAQIVEAKKEFRDAAIRNAKATARSKFTVASAPPAASPLQPIRLIKPPVLNLDAAILRAKPKAK